MPIALLLAVAASLGIHAAALFGTDIELFGGAEENRPLLAELQPPPSVAPPLATPKPIPPASKPRPKVAKPLAPVEGQALAHLARPPEPSVAFADSVPERAAENVTETAPESASTAAVQPAPVQPRLPASGRIRFAIYYGTQGFQIGRAEHRWEFAEDGTYQLFGMTETTGLVALIKGLRFENESRGRLLASGLQPESYRVRKNGKDANENADFDWSTAAVHLSRSGETQPVARGAQDILSLNYQLAYLPRPEAGSTVGVVTGKKYDRFALDSLGEEDLPTPAGLFRTLHLRTTGDTVTEIWIALDRHRLPVKIRYTDKKGDIFEQVATELGSP